MQEADEELREAFPGSFLPLQSLVHIPSNRHVMRWHAYASSYVVFLVSGRLDGSLPSGRARAVRRARRPNGPPGDRPEARLVVPQG
jgi:hypothetical protein